MKKLRENPTSPKPMDNPHITVYSSSVYACTGQGCMQLSTWSMASGLTNGWGQSTVGISVISPGTKQATSRVVLSGSV